MAPAIDAASRRRLAARKRKNAFFHALFLLSAAAGAAALAALLFQVPSQGLSWLDGDFLTQSASRRPERSGIRAALLGTLWLMAVAAPLTFLIGTATAIYLEEYARDSGISRFIQTNIANLAGVPSIVYGILGLTIFVRVFGFGQSVLSGALTLTLLVLPIMIVAVQEAIRAVPGGLRRASYALGANRWQTIVRVVLPSALPGILTGAILSLSRSIGETAPLIVVGAAAFIIRPPEHLLSPFTALPIQIYTWSSQPQEDFRHAAAAAIIVLLVLLLCMNAAAIVLRDKFQKRL